MHETANNPLVPMVKKLNLEYYYDDGAPLYHTPYGRGNSQFKAKKVADEFVDYCEWYYETNPDAPDRPAQEFLKEYVDRHPLLSKDERVWASCALREIENMTGMDSDYISAKWLPESYYPIERNLYITGGYDKIPNYVAKPLLRDGQILLGQEVQTIDRTVDNHVVITTMKNGEQQTFEGDAVIVTVPLGCLKQDMINFNPPLGPDYKMAFDKNSYAALGKIFFEFDEVFWPKESDQIVFYPTPPEKNPDPDSVMSYCYILNNLFCVAGVKELCIQTTDPLTRRLELMSKKELFDFFKPLFESIRTEPYKDLPELKSLEMTQWTLDKYAGNGTYTSWNTGDDPFILQDVLKKHRGDNLQFAGEHTVYNGNGCVHGAFTSGEMAAKNLLERFQIDFDGDDSCLSSPE